MFIAVESLSEVSRRPRFSCGKWIQEEQRTKSTNLANTRPKIPHWSILLNFEEKSRFWLGTSEQNHFLFLGNGKKQTQQGITESKKSEHNLPRHRICLDWPQHQFLVKCSSVAHALILQCSGLHFRLHGHKICRWLLVWSMTTFSTFQWTW